MIAGGVDAPIAPGILAAFNLMTVLTSEWNDEPKRASRPFSRNRSGIVLGEGAWLYVLEDLEHAQARDAKIYAEITGYGATCDAYHRVRLEEGGDEPARAMRLALQDAGRSAEDVDYVNLHGTSTLLNDRIETSALKLAFDGHAQRIPMSATKSQVGHPQGASGAAGLGAALCAMHEHMIPPTINLDEPDPDCDLDYVTDGVREAAFEIAMSNSAGFGGHNATLLARRWTE
jgi:3-oxoacyl-[acyl-carrier-protein] synthase II